MRTLRFLLALLFIILAFYETSGLHPLIWILLFGVMALLSILAMFNVFFRPVLLAAAFGFLLYILFSFQKFTDVVHEQLTIREFWNQPDIRYLMYAVLCFVVCTSYLVQALRTKSHLKRLQSNSQMK